MLARSGFDNQHQGLRPSEAARLEERSWHRDGESYVRVDLHRGFHGVLDWSAWWEVLVAHRQVLAIEGHGVNIPDRVASALIAALHASKAVSRRKAVEDLRRALRVFDDDEWRRAAELAHAVGASEAFVAALCRLSDGEALAARLGITASSPLMSFRATSVDRGAGSLNLVLGPGTWPQRAHRLWDVTFPSRTVLAKSRHIASHGPGGLALARLGRLWVIVTRLPRLAVAWRRTSHSVRRRRVDP